MTTEPKTMNTQETPAEVGIDVQRLVRPSTRGELARRLKNGEQCEVAAHVAEMTSIMLRGWLNCDNFTVTPSLNSGWVIYGPNVEIRDAEDKRPRPE